MKKVVRMLGLCALVALAFTSCKKKETNGTVSFKAAMPETTTDNRTHLNVNNWVVWDAGDKITIFNNDGSGYIETELENGQDATIATFKGDANFLANLETPNQYTAFYPVFNNDGTNVTFRISNQQNYVEDGFMDELYPMFATNVNSATTDFQFKSQAGVLSIPIKMGNNQMEPYTIKRIVLTALYESEELVGDMTYSFDKPYETTPTYSRGNQSHIVELVNCDTEPLTSDARYFNFVLLEGALLPQPDNQPTFKIELYDVNDNLIPVYNNDETPQLVNPLTGYTPYGIVAQEKTMMAPIVLKRIPQ